MKSLETKKKTPIRDLLHEVQLQMPEAMARKGQKGPQAMGPREQLIELPRTRREKPPRRPFLKFTFVNRQAQSRNLRKVLKMPHLVMPHLHPAPAEKIIMCERFQPQKQTDLLNYTKLAKTFDIEESLDDDLENCECKKMLQVPEARRDNGIRACGKHGHTGPTMGVA